MVADTMPPQRIEMQVLSRCAEGLRESVWAVLYPTEKKINEFVRILVLRFSGVKPKEVDFGRPIFGYVGEKRLMYHPTVSTLKREVEPLVSKILGDSQKFETIQRWRARLDNGLTPSSGHILHLLKQICGDIQLPIYQIEVSTRKREHVVFHYLALVLHYLLARALGIDVAPAYQAATRFARFSVVDPFESDIIRHFEKVQGLREYCDENGLIFNVVANAASLLVSDEPNISPSFVILDANQARQNVVRIVDVFHDSGSWEERSLIGEPEWVDAIHSLETGLLNAVNNNGGVLKLGEQQSYQDWFCADGGINTSVRLLNKGTQWWVVKVAQHVDCSAEFSTAEL